MPTTKREALMLTEEEAFAILGLCLTSPQKLDGVSEQAIRKVAEYCAQHVRVELSNHKENLQAGRSVS